MNGVGNYGPQAGQGSSTSVPPASALPPPPPRPPPQHIQPGVPQKFQTSQVLSQPCSMPTAPPPTVQVHQSAPMHTSYQTVQWNSHWNPNVHHVFPAMGPRAPGVLPLPPPQTQLPRPGGSVHMSLQAPGNVQAFEHVTHQTSHLQSSVFSSSFRIPSTGPPLPPSLPVGAPPIPQSSPSSHLPTTDTPAQKEDGRTGSTIGSTVSENLVLDIPASSEPHDWKTQQRSDAQDNSISSMRVPAIYSSHRSNDSVDAGVTLSPANSDMEMEDDFIHPDEEQKDHHLECVSPLSKLDAQQSQGAVSTAECGLVDVVEEDRRGSFGSSYISDSLAKKSSTGLNFSVMSPFRDVAEVQHSSPIHENSHQSYTGTGSEIRYNQLTEDPSPFSLLQGYASGDCSNNNNNDKNAIQIENVSLAIESRSTEVQTVVNEDAGKSLDCSPVSQKVVSRTDRTCNVAEKSMDDSSDSANEEHRHKDALRDVNTSAIGLPSEDVKSKSASLKFDAFGRLAQEGASDSDSEDSPRYTRRRGRREKSSSRSRSPYGRRRRSPRRRKDKRGRSRSVSPKRRRSRSRSPFRRRRSRSVSPKRRRSRSKSPFRHEFGGSRGDKMRRGKNQLQECFDFKKGKCYRAASCRYIHHEFDKGSKSRTYRSKEQLQTHLPSSRSPDLHEETRTTDRTIHEINETKNQEMKLCKEIYDMGDKRLGETESPSQMHGKESHAESSASPVTDVKPEKRSNDATASVPSSVENAVLWQSQSQNTDQICQGAGYDSSISGLSTLQTSTSVPLQHSRFPDLKQIPAINVPLPSFFPPSFPALSHGSSATSAHHLRGEYNNMPQFNSACIGMFPPYQHPPLAPQQSHFPNPLNTAWSSLPPTMPPPNQSHLSFVNNAVRNTALGQYVSAPAQFQQSTLLPRNDLGSQESLRSNQNALPNISQVAQHQAYMQSQQFSSMGLPSKNAEIRPGDSLPPGALPVPSSQSYPFMGQQPFVPNHSEAAGASVYASDSLDRNREPYLSGFGGSRISSYTNSYAPTFEQPLASKINSDAQIEVKGMLSSDRKGVSLSFHNVPADGLPAESLGSQNAPQHTACADNRVLSMPGGDQYDPLFDSIEPSTNSLPKSGPVQKLGVTVDSGALLRFNGWNNPLDVEENNMQKGGGTIAIAASTGNDEYGETADAEVGAVENESPSGSNDVGDMDEGVEIDQVRTSGKSKKSKDSRSTKLFKNSIANFVKELLKPSWRQGNMSKEVFKTIVKKTVEKVSGAMKSHKVPKSQEKINHYIDSSQRKLTKLVMGYVDKYVKV